MTKSLFFACKKNIASQNIRRLQWRVYVMLPKKYTTHCWEQGYSVVWKNPRKGLANKSQIDENPLRGLSSPSFPSNFGGTFERRESENWPSPLCKIREKDTDVTYQPNGPNWPSLLDSFSLIAGQIATLIKYLKAPNTPVLG